MKIIHLSDLHLRINDTYIVFQDIVQKILKFKKTEKDLVVIITGDILDDAKDALHCYALKEINSLKKVGIPVLIIPGNHDYGDSGGIDKKYVAPFKQTYFDDDTVVFPKVDVFGGIAFFGLDSMQSDYDGNHQIGAQGYIDDKQLQELHNKFIDLTYKDLKKVVYLHHCPFTEYLSTIKHEDLKLRNSLALKAVIAGNIDALLCGHIHFKDKDNTIPTVFNGTWDIPRVYNAGSSTHSKNHFGFVRIIDLSKDPIDDTELKQ